MKADAAKWGEWSLEGDDKKFKCTRNVEWGGDTEDGLKEGLWEINELDGVFS